LYIQEPTGNGGHFLSYRGMGYWWGETGGENRSTWRKNCSIDTVFTTNPIWTTLRSNCKRNPIWTTLRSNRKKKSNMDYPEIEP